MRSHILNEKTQLKNQATLAQPPTMDHSVAYNSNTTQVNYSNTRGRGGNNNRGGYSNRGGRGYQGNGGNAYNQGYGGNITYNQGYGGYNNYGGRSNNFNRGGGHILITSEEVVDSIEVVVADFHPSTHHNHFYKAYIALYVTETLTRLTTVSRTKTILQMVLFTPMPMLPHHPMHHLNTTTC